MAFQWFFFQIQGMLFCSAIITIVLKFKNVRRMSPYIRRVWWYQRKVIRIYKSKKNRQYNGQKKQDKGTNNDLQNIAQKTKDWATRTPLKIGGELVCSGMVSSSCSTSDNRRVTLVTTHTISHEWGKDRVVLTTSGTYPWSFVIQIFRNG